MFKTLDISRKQEFKKMDNSPFRGRKKYIRKIFKKDKIMKDDMNAMAEGHQAQLIRE
jgi:hypothetical protein